MDSKPLVVSERSWHYRLLKFAYGNEEDFPPKTLCGYFWSVVLAPAVVFVSYLAKWTLIAAFERIVKLGDVGAAIVFTALTSSGLTAWGLLDWISLAVVTGTCVGVLVAALVVGGVAVAISDRREKKKRPETTSTARLLLATVKAKKRRICPLIEVRS